MGKQHKHRHGHGQYTCGGILLAGKCTEDDGVEQKSHARAERDKLRADHDNEKDHKADKAADGRDHQYNHRGGGHALATLELIENGEHMSHHDEQARNGSAELIDVVYRRAGVGIGCNNVGAHHKISDPHGYHGLEHIAQQGQHRGTLAVCTQHIRGACVTAAVLTNVIVILFAGDDQPKIEAA